MHRVFIAVLVSVVFCLCAQGSFADISDGLVAYYPFTGTADDASGNGHDGTVLGACLTADRFGHTNSAYHFDGVDDFIDIGLFDAGIKTVSMWVRQGSRNEFEFYFGHNTFRLYASTLDNGRLMYGDGSPNKTYTSARMDDYVGQWVHIVVVGVGTDSKVYLNGVNVTESSGNVGPALASIVNLGRWPGPVPSASHYMQGDIDDLRIYNRVLSESEIADLYWGVPSVPQIFQEPLCTIGRSNEIAWTMQDGPVEYWVEAKAVMHYAPFARPANSAPNGWNVQNRFAQNLDVWNKASGWIPSTNYLFTGLRLNTIYMYRVKASVMTDIGRLEGEWSDWTSSCQVPVIPKSN